MKWNILWLLLAAAVVVGLWNDSLPQQNYRVGMGDSLISTTPCDIDGDGQDETIEIFLTSGQRFDERRMYCGDGDKWKGSFVIRVRAGFRTLHVASLNQLLGRDELQFWAPEFQLQIDDLNADGLMDFSVLEQYAGCNGSFYALITIDPEKGFRRLSDESFYASPPNTNSTKDIFGEDRQMGVRYYSQSARTSVIDWRVGDSETATFVLDRRQILDH